MAQPQFAFGAGSLYAIPKTDATGTAITTPTPVKFGTIQSFTLDASFDVKELYGQNQFPVAAGRGKGKITGKMQFAQINGLLYNQVLFGQTLSKSIDGVYNDTTGTAIPSSSPYTITPTPPSSGTWATDLSVINLATGSPLTRIASGTPTTGQYTVSAGVYTFAAADAGTTVLINYEYTGTSTSAPVIDIYNVAMGYAPTFQIVFNQTFQGQQQTFILPQCTASKFALATKLDDFTVPEIDFVAYADPLTNKIMRLSTTAM